MSGNKNNDISNWIGKNAKPTTYEKFYTKKEVIHLVNEYECSRFLGEISTPDFESWLNNKEK